MIRTLSFPTAVRGFDANGRRRGVRLFPGDELLLALEPRNRYDVNAVTASLARQFLRSSVLCGRIAKEHSALVARAIRFANANGMEVVASVVSVVDESPPARYGNDVVLDLQTRINIRVSLFVWDAPTVAQLASAHEFAVTNNRVDAQADGSERVVIREHDLSSNTSSDEEASPSYPED